MGEHFKWTQVKNWRRTWTQVDMQDNVPLSPNMFSMEHRQIWVQRPSALLCGIRVVQQRLRHLEAKVIESDGQELRTKNWCSSRATWTSSKVVGSWRTVVKRTIISIVYFYFSTILYWMNELVLKKGFKYYKIESFNHL